jgi:hypothetical protein
LAPAFNAYPSAGVAVTTATWTKLALNVKLYDTGNCFDNTSQYRFTPTVAGYYYFHGTVQINNFANRLIVYIYKNGSSFWAGEGNMYNTATVYPNVHTSGLTYMNGTTDYVELYMYQTSGSNQTYQAGQSTWFEGFLARSA